MRMRGWVIVAAAAAAGFGLAGCPSSSCPKESPQVNAGGIPTSCTAAAGQPVTYPVRICPTCNQSSATCVVDMSAAATSGDIFLDTKVETCSGSGSCSQGCQASPISCTFTAPAASATPYMVTVFDGGSGTTLTSQLTVTQGGPASCALSAAGI